MDIRQLRYFLHVAELQSLSRAAAQLRVAQPALTRQIKGLEEELGVLLLRRHGWGVTPTPAGQILMNHARQLVQDIDAARDAVQAYQAEPSGPLSFGVPSSLSHAVLPGLAVRLRQRAPRVRLRLADGFSGTIHDWLIQGRLDLAVLYDTKLTEGLIATPLMQEEMLLIGPVGRFHPGQAMGLADAARLDLALPARPHRLRLLFDQALAEQDLACTPVLELDALPALIELARLGAACTLLPRSAVQSQIDQVSLCPLTPAIHRRLVLARPQGRLPTPATVALEQELFALLHRGADCMGWHLTPQ